MEGPISLDTAQAVRHAVLQVTLLARQSLNIYSPDLDPVIFDQQPFIDAVRRLATGHRRARIRILLRDPNRAIKDGHRLLGLAHRLSSRISLRVPGPNHQDYGSAFVVVDDAHVLFDAAPDRYTARMTRADRPRAKELMIFFNDVWEHAHRDPDLRELTL